MSREHSPGSREITSRFGNLLAELARKQVDFAVVGGLAVIFNGYERVTLDADILVNSSLENIRKLLEVLAGWGEGWARELTPDDFRPEEGCVRVTEEFDLDIFTRMQGKSLDNFQARLLQLEVGGLPIKYLPPEDLILLKQNSWRDKDKLDVQAMREIIAGRAAKPE